jgi:hypothetical protein
VAQAALGKRAKMNNASAVFSSIMEGPSDSEQVRTTPERYDGMLRFQAREWGGALRWKPSDLGGGRSTTEWKTSQEVEVKGRHT